jgi:MOSC domain-containing protein YiiM
MPCHKLALKFGRADLIAQFWKTGRCGLYLSVLEEGDIGSGDAITISRAHPPLVTISELFSLLGHDSIDEGVVRRALLAPALPVSWRDYLVRRFPDLAPQRRR